MMPWKATATSKRSEGSAVETARGVSLPWTLIRARAVNFSYLHTRPVIPAQHRLNYYQAYRIAWVLKSSKLPWEYYEVGHTRQEPAVYSRSYQVFHLLLKVQTCGLDP